MNAVIIQITVAKAEERFLAARLERINEAAFLVLVGMARIKHHAIARLERGFQFQRDAFAMNAADLAEVHAALLSEARVDQFLIVVAAKPAGVKPARKRHFQIVLLIFFGCFRRRLICGWRF